MYLLSASVMFLSPPSCYLYFAALFSHKLHILSTIVLLKIRVQKALASKAERVSSFRNSFRRTVGTVASLVELYRAGWRRSQTSSLQEKLTLKLDVS